MREQLLQGFWLGPLRIDLRTGTVTGDGPPAHLPSRAVEVLLRLAHDPGELVTRAELLDAVWGEGQGSEEALSHAVSELRRGLGEDAARPRFVQTVPRRGYRLLVDPRLDAAAELGAPGSLEIPFWKELMKRGVVQAAAAHLVVGWLLIQVAGETFDNLGLPPWATPAVTYVVVAGFPVVVALAWFLEFAEGRMTLDTGDGRRRRGGLERNYLAIVAAYVVAAAGVGVYQLTVGLPFPDTVVADAGSDPEQALPVEANSIAVLRFRPISDNERARIFSDGLAEDILDRLARVPGLAVSSRTDAWSLPENANSAEVRRRLRVARYLEGSVRLQDDDLRVTVQLIDSDGGFHDFSRTFDRQLEDFMEVQREITNLVVANLRVALEPETENWLADSYPDTDLDAYVLYRKGRSILASPLTEESLDQAVAYFREAIALDPAYAAAHAGSCIAFVEFFERSGDPEDIEKAEASCATALVSDPNLYVVYAAMGDLYQRTNRPELAELAYGNALERHEKDVRSIIGLAEVHEKQNRLDLAETALRRAIRSQPGNWRAINALGTFYFSTGRFVDAANEFRKVVYLDPANWQAQGNLGSAFLMSGRFGEAAEALRTAIDIHPEQTYWSNLGIVYYYLGRFEDAVEAYRAALDLAPRSNITWLNLADALHFAGDSDGARDAYRRAADLSAERIAVNAGDAESLETLAWAKAMLGESGEARELMDRAISLAPNDPYAWYYDALIRSRAGDPGGALDAAATALREGYSTVMLEAEPFLGELREYERFRDMLASKPGR